MSQEEEERRASQGWLGSVAPPPSQPFVQAGDRRDAHAPPLQQTAQAQTAQQNGSFPPFLTPPIVENSSTPQILQLMHQQMAQQQQILLQLMRQKEPAASEEKKPEQILDSLCGHIKEFTYDADAGTTFAAWYARYEDLFQKDAAQLEDEAKVRMLMRKLGTSEHDRYTSYILPNHPRDFSLEETVSQLTVLFGIKESLLHRRFRCLKLAKLRTEDFVSFACRVNKGAAEFELSRLTEEQLKCLVFVCGLKDEADLEFRTRLLHRIEENQAVTLHQLSAECQRMTNLRQDSAMIEQDRSEQVLSVQRSAYRPHRASSPQKNTNSTSKPSRPCWLCGALHWSRECTFKTHTCTQCGAVGHREGYCKQQHKKGQRRQERRFPKRAHTRSVMVNVCSIHHRRKYLNVAINGIQIRLQLDTASDISVISRNLWKKVGCPQLSPPSVTARSASGDQLEIVGEFRATVAIKQQRKRAVIYVANSELALLGIDLAEAFALWSVPIDQLCNRVTTALPNAPEEIERKFPRLFQPAMGLCTKAQVKLHLKENYRPVFCPKRPVAYAMHDAVNKELDRLEILHIITPVDFSEWAAPIVVVRKANGSIRICGDYSTGLNAALNPHDYPLPLPQDIFAKLSNCTIFTQIDLSDAFLQVPVDEESRPLLTVNTHRGLYLYNRLPPGIKDAPGAFQQLVDAMLSGISGVSCYMDDIIIGGRTASEHNESLFAVLNRMQEYGFTLRASKCAFEKAQIKYLGHIIDGHGIRPDPEKVATIANLPEPKDVTGVRSFLGAINFYGKFIPNMRNLRYPLDKLLQEGNMFTWTAECQKAFKQFKNLLSSELMLVHCDPKLPIVVSADALTIGLGATIGHRFPDGTFEVIQHASRALTKAEKNYSQIDREGLAIIYAVTKFHKYIFGRHFLLQTDHKPLLRIFGSKKGIPVYTANRLQRFALTLQLYDFEIEYVSTTNFGNADVLSRLIKTHERPEEDYVIAVGNNTSQNVKGFE
ncbi:uncharacterized protein K02A2.6-like [Anopheles ziemanni]|uniref:uncharacterized protein K02A2.6-like n=1 Tax=Anopheles coustani TaxID=139045 RepID=UPI00265A552C|nr:uncharacterized protein K02A2.6-like [Anopheles coustani]XP_058177763.1 uncharacterized protein K02A2.6-like [Anopheles ziemanni]